MESVIALYIRCEPQRDQLAGLLDSIADCVRNFVYERALDYYEVAFEQVLSGLPADEASPSDDRAALQRSALRVARSELLVHLGRWDQALEDVERVLYVQRPVQDPSLLLRALLTAAQASCYYGDYAEAIRNLERAQGLAGTAGDRLMRARVALEKGRALAGHGDIRAARERLGAVEELLSGSPDLTSEELEVLARSFMQRGLSAFQEHQLSVAQQEYQWALQLCETIPGGSVAEAEILRYLAILESVQGSHADALRHQRRALHIYHRFRLPLGMAKTYSALGQCCLDASHLEEALVFIQMAERLSRQLGAESEVALVYSKLGRCYTQLGQYFEGVMFHLKDVEMCRRFSNYRGLAYATHNLGLAHRSKGDMEEALVCLQESLVRFQEMGDRPHIAHVHLELARTYLDRSRLNEVQIQIGEAARILAVYPNEVDRGAVMLLSGILQRLGQRYAEAEQSLFEGQRIFSATGLDGSLAECHGELAMLYLEMDRSDLALEQLKVALRLARRLDMHNLVRDCVAQLARLDQLALVTTLVDCVIQGRPSWGAPCDAPQDFGPRASPGFAATHGS